ncbi:MAG TPA: hypothetical protein VE913_15785 [Longimicrobium sp.]|nr:hypothetical protein [Longimicrobium sp.]
MNAEWWSRHDVARRRMRRATITAMAMGVLSAWGAPRLSGDPGAAVAYPVAALYWILGVGIHTRSRVCAALLLGMEVAIRLAGLVLGMSVVATLIGLVILGFIFLHGLLGTLEDHRLRAEMEAPPA